MKINIRCPDSCREIVPTELDIPTTITTYVRIVPEKISTRNLHISDDFQFFPWILCADTDITRTVCLRIECSDIGSTCEISIKIHSQSVSSIFYERSRVSAIAARELITISENKIKSVIHHFSRDFHITDDIEC